jgi:hypothetical protein
VVFQEDEAAEVAEVFLVVGAVIVAISEEEIEEVSVAIEAEVEVVSAVIVIEA